MQKLLPIFFSAFFLLSACGGGANTSDAQKSDDDDKDLIINTQDNCPHVANKDQLDTNNNGIGDACENNLSLKERALKKISEYARSKGVSEEPTVKDYVNAGVVEVTNENLLKINQKVSQLTKAEVDTESEIRKILKDLDISISDADFDGDGIKDSIDNCPSHVNPAQNDLDNDKSGDACDLDDDSDSIYDSSDNCPLVFNPNQKDANKNGIGDVCESKLITITSTSLTTGIEGELYSYDVEASGANVEGVLNFSLDAFPVGMTIDTVSGLIKWTPTLDQIGSHSVVIRVTDDSGLSDNQSFTVIIEAKNSAPTVKNVTIKSKKSNYLVGDKLEVGYNYFDAEGDSQKEITFSWYRDGVEVIGRKDSFYILDSVDIHKEISASITPYASSGVTKGVSVQISAVIKQVIEPQDIKDAFNEHYTYFEGQMLSRLATDSEGYHDTYVLYDVQTFMQNAAIYADERGDKEILERLLALVLIPFEPKYLTNGKWLNNNHNLVGVEVELVIAQYFNLLTRVLSASERHGISTNFSDANIAIVNVHINKWVAKTVNRNRVDDRQQFFIGSALQFYDFLKKTNKPTTDFVSWEKYTQDYLSLSIVPKWDVENCDYKGVTYKCWMLDRTGWADYADFEYAGYGKEYTKTNSDTDPFAMFDADGIVKQPVKPLTKVATDVSHARRFNWFFETIKRFGEPFNATISDEALEGWANNLAYRVSQGTLDEPYFTIFSDGVDGWYRVNYYERKSFGYAPGDMDLSFVTSTYGFSGVYNPKIYDWMEAWENKNGFNYGYYGAWQMGYLTSLVIDIRKSLKK